MPLRRVFPPGSVIVTSAREQYYLGHDCAVLIRRPPRAPMYVGDIAVGHVWTNLPPDDFMFTNAHDDLQRVEDPCPARIRKVVPRAYRVET